MAAEKVTYSRAEEVRDIAEKLIDEYHPHLAAETILYVFRSKAAEMNGKIVLGKAKRVTGLNAYLAFQDMGEDAESFYVIEIAGDMWLALNEAQRHALVDHELSHIGPDGMRAHDVEEFRDVIERHGLWRPDLSEFIETAKQAPLFPMARESAMREAFENLRPKTGSVTITAAGESVTLHAKDVH